MKNIKENFKPLIAITRADTIENIHYGSYCIVDKVDNVIYSYGNYENIIYARSTAKPFQALAVILSDAYEKFKLTSKELAIICSSHFAEEDHVETVLSILSKIGLSENDLLTPFVYSRNRKIKEKQISNGLKPSRLFSDCSGKHAGMLAVCKASGYSTNNYLAFDHPLQKKIIEIASIIYTDENLKIGIDGCGAPVFATRLESMAKSYLTLITCKLDNKQIEYAKKYGYSVDELENAFKLIRNSMLENPKMIAGTSGLCSLLISIYGGACIAKVGAAGVYCLGICDFVTKKSVGIALKISDGSIEAAEFAIVSILYRLNLLPSTRSNLIDNFLLKKNLNEHEKPVGQYIFLDNNLPPLSDLI